MARSLFSLDGSVALVTGGNGGLGQAMARGLRDFGATVCVTGRDPRKNASAAIEFGDDAVFELDVRDESQVENAFQRLISRFGRLDVLVNNAGGFRGGALTELPREAWDDVISSHLTGSFLCGKHAAKEMIRRGEGGKIIMGGSMYSVFGPPDFADYAAAKAGVLGLTRALAVELAPHGILVNAILPGWYETELTHGMPQAETGQLIRRKTPLDRWGTPGDLVGPVVFLASRASDFVTGVSLPVDGGYSIADRLRTP